jgi:hypothetical protein
MWLLGWIAMQSAVAAPLMWNWDHDQERRYVTGAYFQSPFALTLVDADGQRVRAAQVGLQAVMTCTVDSIIPNGRGWFIACPIEDASVWAVPVLEDAGGADEAVFEYEAWMEKTTVAFKLTPDGRVSQPRITAVEGNSPRSRFILKMVERMLARAVSSLDTQLNDTDEGSWALRQSAATAFPLDGVLSQFKGRVSYGGSNGEDELLVTAFKGGYGYNNMTFKGTGQQSVRFAAADGCVARSGIDLRAAANSVDAAGIVSYRLSAYVEQVGEGEEITLDASKGW